MGETASGSGAPLGPLVFPDPLTSTQMVSAATFLYFESPVVLPSPIWIPDENAYGLHELVDERRPEWASRYFRIDSLYGAQVDAWKVTKDLLNPLGDAFLSSLYAFDADETALEDGLLFLESTGETMDSALARIDVGAAAGEVFHHLLIDKYFELDRDLEALFKYCDRFFSAKSPAQLLVPCYLPRLRLAPRAAGASEVLLFNNSRLLTMLEKLPVEVPEKSDTGIAVNVVAWEIFAQILSQQLDPLDADRIDRVVRVRVRHDEEVRSLRRKCLLLADDMPPIERLDTLIESVERFVRHHVNDELASLFDLNRSAFDSYVEAVFTDEKTWLATATSVASALAGQGVLTAGAALATVSSLGSKAAKTAFDRRRKLRTSDYRLLYRIGRTTV